MESDQLRVTRLLLKVAKLELARRKAEEQGLYADAAEAEDLRVNAAYEAAELQVEMEGEHG